MEKHLLNGNIKMPRKDKCVFDYQEVKLKAIVLAKKNHIITVKDMQNLMGAKNYQTPENYLKKMVNEGIFNEISLSKYRKVYKLRIW